MKGALTEIIQLATLDSDPWVLMVADILKSFPDTGALNLELEEQNLNVQDILGELREKGRCEHLAAAVGRCHSLCWSAGTALCPSYPLTLGVPRVPRCSPRLCHPLTQTLLWVGACFLF